jgi:hypothetical protein
MSRDHHDAQISWSVRCHEYEERNAHEALADEMLQAVADLIGSERFAAIRPSI